jgi:hypothetical protein
LTRIDPKLVPVDQRITAVRLPWDWLPGACARRFVAKPPCSCELQRSPLPLRTRTRRIGGKRPRATRGLACMKRAETPPTWEPVSSPLQRERGHPESQIGTHEQVALDYLDRRTSRASRAPLPASSTANKPDAAGGSVGTRGRGDCAKQHRYKKNVQVVGNASCSVQSAVVDVLSPT